MAPELPDPSFAKIVVLTPDAEAREVLKHRLRTQIAARAGAGSAVRVTQLVFGPYSPFPVAFRVMGPDPAELREDRRAGRGVMMRAIPKIAPGQPGLGRARARASLRPRPGPPRV